MQIESAISQQIADLLRRHQHTIAVAESSTGGLISASLLAVPGASRYFLAGAVVYTQSARNALLGITDEDMSTMRSASEPYAAFLAARVRERHQATWGVAETGAAGPTGNRYGDAAGHTCIAIAGPINKVLTVETGESDRGDNMRQFTKHALNTLHAVLQSIKGSVP